MREKLGDRRKVTEVAAGVLGGGQLAPPAALRKIKVESRIGFCSVKNVAHLRTQPEYEFRFYLVLFVSSLNFS